MWEAGRQKAEVESAEARVKAEAAARAVQIQKEREKADKVGRIGDRIGAEIRKRTSRGEDGQRGAFEELGRLPGEERRCRRGEQEAHGQDG